MPKNSDSHQGFTLIELLITIAIIAILATIAFTTYTSVQKRARDSRRQSELDSIAKVFESGKNENSTTYNALDPTQFNKGAIPQDTTTAKYCIATVTSGSTAPTKPDTWATSSACGSVTSGLYTYNAINTPSGSNLGAGATAWTICALLESGTNPNVFCLLSSQ